MDINQELEGMSLVAFADADEQQQQEFISKFEESDYGIISCNSLTCEVTFTEDGSYFEDDMKEFCEYEDIDFEYVEINSIKKSIAHVKMTKDIEIVNGEIKELGTESETYSVYCSNPCAKSSYRSFLLMRKRYEEEKAGE